jgi:hypothetical protein
VYGQGFLFDDADTRSTPVAEMHRLVAKDPRNAERIFPYIGGEEVNTSPTHAHHRWVINFGEMTEAEARRWSDLLAIVERKVKPERMKLRDNPDGRRRKECWWLWGRYTPALDAAIRGLDRVLVCSQTSKYLAFVFLPATWVYAHKLVVVPLSTFATFSVLQGRCHEMWAELFGSTMKDDPVYTPSDCFETFPFADAFDTAASLEAAGRAYYEFRAVLMVRNDEGLTKTYNRFHDPDERSPDILRLRELHAAMDRAVLDAYGWTDIEPRCDFLLDYNEEDDGSDRRKPWRYRWPDEVRDEILARLLKLNQERAEAERLSGAAAVTAATANPSRRGRRRRARSTDEKSGSLFAT